MSQRVLAQVVAQPRRSRSHLQAQVKLLRRIRKIQIRMLKMKFQKDEKLTNEASAKVQLKPLPQKAYPQEEFRNYRWWTSG